MPKRKEKFYNDVLGKDGESPSELEEILSIEIPDSTEPEKKENKDGLMPVTVYRIVKNTLFVKTDSGYEFRVSTLDYPLAKEGDTIKI